MSSNTTLNTWVDVVDSSLSIDSLDDCVTIDTSSIGNYTYATSFNSPSPYTIGAAGSNYGNITLNGSSTWGTGSTKIGSYNPSKLQVCGDAEFEGDVKIKGVSIAEQIEKINQRLAILVPDPAKLEHFAALKKAYDHYKTLEALCELPSKEQDV